MARNGVVSRRWRSEKIDDFDLSPAAAVAVCDDVHVLAVDDSIIDRKVIERLLKISSCKVTAVDSGRRALQYLGLDEEKTSSGFHGLKVDLIITDYCMPGMTGYELLKKIKESSVLREIPVVIMSSENVLARIDRCLEEGAEDFIVKPVKLSDVKRLKDYTMTTRDVTTTLGNEDRCLLINKRKSRETTSDLSSSDSPLSSSPSPPSISSSPPSISSSSPSPLLPQPSPLSDPSPLHASLDSPTRRLKMTSCV